MANTVIKKQEPIKDKKPRKARELTPEEKAVKEQRDALNAKLKELREKATAARSLKRKQEAKAAFTIYRYCQHHMDDQDVLTVLKKSINALGPTEPGDAGLAKLAAERKFLQDFIASNR